jgi:hypothetical protein
LILSGLNRWEEKSANNRAGFDRWLTLALSVRQ